MRPHTRAYEGQSKRCLARALEERAQDVVVVVDHGERVPRLRGDDVDDRETQPQPHPLQDSGELFVLWRPCHLGLPRVTANDVGRARETTESDLPAGALLDRGKPVTRQKSP
jgi:hypothetical protein